MMVAQVPSNSCMIRLAERLPYQRFLDVDRRLLPSRRKIYGTALQSVRELCAPRQV